MLRNNKNDVLMSCRLPATNSYEEMPENPVVAEAVSALQKPVSSSPPKTCTDFQDNQSETESYDDVDEITNGEISSLS